jgi:hypothetical protein
MVLCVRMGQLSFSLHTLVITNSQALCNAAYSVYQSISSPTRISLSVSIQNGLVTERGTFSQLNELDGYVRRLNIPATQNLLDLKEDHTGNDGAQSTDEAQESPAEQEGDSTVHSAPTGVYRCYINVVGKMMCATYLMLAVIYAFLYNFPRR